MVNFFDVLFFYFYTFYNKIVKDPDPGLVTILGLGFLQAIIPNAILQIIFLKLYCVHFGAWRHFLITIIVVIINYFLYIKSGRLKKIIKTQPKIANSKRLSLVVVIAFFIVTASYLFWGPIYTKAIFEKCK